MKVPFLPLDVLANRDAAESTGGHSVIEGDALGLDPSLRLVLALSRALLSLGMPASRVEDALNRLSLGLGLSIDAFCTPTALVLSLREGNEVRTRVVRVEPGATNLEKLAALHQVVRRVEKRRLAPIEAATQVEDILNAPNRYPESWTVVAYGVVSGAATVALNGTVEDIWTGAILGSGVGLLDVISLRVGSLHRILPLLAAIFVSAGASMLSTAVSGCHPSILVVASLLVLLPGLMLSTATLELATLHLVSGVARLAGAAVVFLQLGLGVALGSQLTPWPHPARILRGHPIPEMLQPLSTLSVALGFIVLLRIRPRDTLVVTASVAVAHFVSRQASSHLGAELGAFLGGLCVAVVAHLHARARDRAVMVSLVPGLLTLVPGSVGFLSIQSMLDGHEEAAIATGFRMLLVATAIACGVLVGTVAMPPRRAL